MTQARTRESFFLAPLGSPARPPVSTRPPSSCLLKTDLYYIVQAASATAMPLAPSYQSATATRLGRPQRQLIEVDLSERTDANLRFFIRHAYQQRISLRSLLVRRLCLHWATTIYIRWYRFTYQVKSKANSAYETRADLSDPKRRLRPQRRSDDGARCDSIGMLGADSTGSCSWQHLRRSSGHRSSCPAHVYGCIIDYMGDRPGMTGQYRRYGRKQNNTSESGLSSSCSLRCRE